MRPDVLQAVQRHFDKNDPEALVFPRFGEHFQEEGFDDVVVLNKFHAMRCLMHVWNNVDVPDLPSFDKVLRKLCHIYDAKLPYVNLDNEKVCALNTVGDFARFADESVSAVLRLQELQPDERKRTENVPSSSVNLVPAAMNTFWAAMPSMASLAPVAAGAVATAAASTAGTRVQQTLQRLYREERHPEIYIEEMGRIDLDGNEINSLITKMCMLVGHGRKYLNYRFVKDGEFTMIGRDHIPDNVVRDIERVWGQFSSGKDSEKGLEEFAYFLNMLSKEDFPLTCIYGYNHDDQNDVKLPGYGLVVTKKKILPATRLFGVFSLEKLLDQIEYDWPVRDWITAPDTNLLLEEIIGIVRRGDQIPILVVNGKGGLPTGKDLEHIETFTHAVAAVARITLEESRKNRLGIKDQLGMAKSLSMLADASSGINRNSPEELKKFIAKAVDRFGSNMLEEIRDGIDDRFHSRYIARGEMDEWAVRIARAQKCGVLQMMNGCFETKGMWALRDVNDDQQTWQQIFLRIVLTDTGFGMLTNGTGLVDNDIPIIDKVVLNFIADGVNLKTLQLLGDSNLSPTEFIQGLSDFEELKKEAAKVVFKGRYFSKTWLARQVYSFCVYVVVRIVDNHYYSSELSLISVAIGFLVTLAALVSRNPIVLLFYAKLCWSKCLMIPWYRSRILRLAGNIEERLVELDNFLESATEYSEHDFERLSSIAEVNEATIEKMFYDIFFPPLYMFGYDIRLTELDDIKEMAIRLQEDFTEKKRRHWDLSFKLRDEFAEDRRANQAFHIFRPA